MKKLLITSAIVTSSFMAVGCSPQGKQAEFKDSKIVVNTDQVKAESTNYKIYSAENIPTDAPYIVFFHAEWCPTCVKWEKEVLGEGWDENVVILKADYDTEKALKDKYGVKKQSTAVFIDAEGNLVKTMSDPKMDIVEDFFEGSEGNEDDSEDESEETVRISDEVSVAIPVLGDVELNAVVVTEEVEISEADVAPAAVYKTYSVDAVPTGQKYALYFHASWCPSCIAFNRKLEGAIDTLPAGTIILKADYDSEVALKKEYGVTSQHTLVTFNEDGSVNAVEPGAGLDNVINFFQ